MAWFFSAPQARARHRHSLLNQDPVSIWLVIIATLLKSPNFLALLVTHLIKRQRFSPHNSWLLRALENSVALNADLISASYPLYKIDCVCIMVCC